MRTSKTNHNYNSDTVYRKQYFVHLSFSESFIKTVYLDYSNGFYVLYYLEKYDKMTYFDFFFSLVLSFSFMLSIIV